MVPSCLLEEREEHKYEFDAVLIIDVKCVLIKCLRIFLAKRTSDTMMYDPYL